jgi:hypothetical protein
MKTAVDLHVFEEFLGALDERRPEVNRCNIDGLRIPSSEFDFEDPSSALEAFDEPIPYADISSIDDEPVRPCAHLADVRVCRSWQPVAIGVVFVVSFLSLFE